MTTEDASGQIPSPSEREDVQHFQKICELCELQHFDEPVVYASLCGELDMAIVGRLGRQMLECQSCNAVYEDAPPPPCWFCGHEFLEE